MRFGVGKRIGPFRAGVSVGRGGLGYGVGAGPFHATGGTGRSSRSKSSSSSNTGTSGTDYYIGGGANRFNTSKKSWRDRTEFEQLIYDDQQQYRRLRAGLKLEQNAFLILLFVSFPALLTLEVFVPLFLFSGASIVKSLFLAIGVAVLGVIVYGVPLFVAIYTAIAPGLPFFYPAENKWEQNTLKGFIYRTSMPPSFWGTFYFQILPVPIPSWAIEGRKRRGDKKLLAAKCEEDALRVKNEFEAQSKLLESNGFPRVGTESPRLLNEQEKNLIVNSLKESRNYVCVCGVSRAKEHFFIACKKCKHIALEIRHQENRSRKNS